MSDEKKKRLTRTKPWAGLLSRKGQYPGSPGNPESLTVGETADTYGEFVRKNSRWNFAVNVSDLTSAHLGEAFIFTTTILPLYASYLTDSAVLIGLIPAIQQVGFMLPQLLTSRKAETLGRKKPFIAKISTMERLPYLFIALSILLIPQAPNWLAYVILAVCIAAASGSGGLASPAWKAMLAKVIHPDRRGMMFGLGLSLGGFFGIGGSLIARQILKVMEFPVSFGFCFLLAFIAQAISWGFLMLNREPEKKPTRSTPPTWEYFKKLPAILRSNKPFTRYLISHFLTLMGTMGVSFYIVYGKNNLGISDEFAATLTMVALVSQSVGVALLGRIGDKIGHKWSTIIATICGIGALVFMLLLPSSLWLIPVFVLVSLTIMGLKVSRVSITMEFSHEDDIPTYTALAGTILGVPILFAPMIGGWIIDTIGYEPMFITAIGFSIVGMLMMCFGFKDPRKQS